MAEAPGKRPKLRRRRAAVRAVQVEPPANAEMAPVLAALADTEPVEHLDLDAREKIRDLIARDQHRVGIEFAHVVHGCQAPLVRTQKASPGTVEEPGSLAATIPDRLL